MSSPQIEREVEDVESEQEDETEQQPQQTIPLTSSTNVDKHVDGELDNTGEASVSQTSKPIYASKTVKKLSNDERSMLMNKFEKGVEDPYFKVIRMSNGAIRITKRRNPIIADVKQAQEERSTRIANKFGDKFGRLTNEQLLMEHIIDLETRFESMRLKHKKLKKRYNELENSIYEDVDTHMDVGLNESQPQQHVQTQPEEPQPERAQVSAGAYTQKRRLKKSSWRDAIDYM